MFGLSIKNFCYSFFFLLILSQNIKSQNKELPLIIESGIQTKKPMIFYISGDGGWNSFDKKMATEFRMADMPFIALNSFKYFWKTKTPDQFTKDMVPVLRNYAKKWNKDEIIFIGYSFGGDVLPFLITRFPDDLKQKIKIIALITPGKTSDFTIHINDMLLFESNYNYDVIKEISKIPDYRIICFFGEKEESIYKEKQTPKNVRAVFIKGGHTFSDSKTVMREIFSDKR